MTPLQRSLVLSLTIIVASQTLSAQVATGTPPFGSFVGGPDVIDLANLNAHLDIPVLHKHGRGMDFMYDISYDTSVWYPVTSGSTKNWQPVSNWGWRGPTEAGAGYISYVATVQLPQNHCYTETFTNWAYHDAWGVGHPFSGTAYKYYGSGGYGCQNYFVGFSNTSGDGSGYKLSVGSNQNNSNMGPVTVYGSQGNVISAPVGYPTGSAGITDRNGNEITVNSTGGWYDTLSSTTAVLTISAPSPPSSTTFTYPAPSASATYTMKYGTYTVQTKFGCSGVSEFGPTVEYLVSEIDLPDIQVNASDKYTFTYEETPGVQGNYTGRLASVTLPTGGTITYKYTGGSGGITCADGSAPGLERYTPDTGSNYWNYSRTAGSGAAYTTTITDPTENVTVMQFQGIYETERQMYEGSVSSSNLLQTIQTCYNGNTSNCNSTAITQPLTQRNITTILSGGLQSEHDDFWNVYGAPTETDDYDYGSGSRGTLLKRVLSTYATTLGNITAFRQTVITCNGNGSSPTCNGTGTPVSEVVYNYDQTTPLTTNSTPQHVSLPAPWGNLTSTYTYTNSNTYNAKTWSYYDTGNPYQFTDVNNEPTTYNYATGSSSCYNSFVTSTTEAVTSLSVSETWSCSGGVQLTSVDENNQTTTTTYSDTYFWRPASVADPTGATTSYCYGLLSGSTCTLNPNQAESTLSFNVNGASSASDVLTTLDGLGRTHLQQTRQAPGSSNFDTVETDYDAIGRISRVTVPYTGTAGQTNSSVSSTTTSYDAVSRKTTVNDAGGGTTTYFYGNPGSQNNDTLVTRSPSPMNENDKIRQFETDALGRSISMCEVTQGTTAWPGGTCGQNTNKTGYWTKYSYDPMNNLLTVVQNAQSSSNQQTRTYTYDWMSRMTSETVPEIGTNGNGTASYTYDSDSTCGTYKGDLVKRVDAEGDVICSTYDYLHRRLTTTYPSGTYSMVTPAKYFVYDSATINISPNTPTAMKYAKARLAEAYTCTGPCSSKLTDIGLSYSVRGESSDIYEATPNSGTTYYHLNQTYWANRGPYQLSGNIGLPTTITNTPDGEGRINSVSASSGQNPVSGTTYNTAQLPMSISLGSGTGDSDGFSYDSDYRMTQYQFTVNNTTLTGVLGWNGNSTLQTQDITDGFNSSDTQNCTYTYDDMTRIGSATCGTAASQSFTYDPFGNINKTGSPYTFNPTYNNSTNRISSVGGTSASYDSNGDVLSDSFHTYTWDADGHAISVDAGLSDAVSLTYDALGRMVEQNRSGSYAQIVWSPSGQKLAIMSAQALQKAMIPLSGKAFAIYNSSGLLYYAHPDFLGTARLATTPTRGLYFDTAYAPFGETYASTGALDPFYTGMMNDTGHRQDTASGLYDFPVREYSTQGRWPSPDPAGKASTCPMDPQTQNRYAYVRNNPINYTDPTGADPFDPFDPGDPFGGGGGGCDPIFDPGCGIGCDPSDPFCGICEWDPWDCPVPIGGGGGRIGFEPNGPVEEPPPFPWTVLPLGFFTSGFGPSATTCVCRRFNTYPVGGFQLCSFDCQCSDGSIVPLTSYTFGQLVLACGPISNCPQYIETTEKVFELGPIGIAYSKKITGCKP